jgi:hypothetical protein
VQSASEILEKVWLEREAKRHAKEDANREKLRRHYLMKKYGVTPEQVLGWLKEQGFKCAICELPIGPELDRDTQVEHCHKTGKIRGIVCLRCNLAIGWLQDDPQRARKIIAYLER